MKRRMTFPYATRFIRSMAQLATEAESFRSPILKLGAGNSEPGFIGSARCPCMSQVVCVCDHVIKTPGMTSRGLRGALRVDRPRQLPIGTPSTHPTPCHLTHSLYISPYKPSHPCQIKEIPLYQTSTTFTEYVYP
jgi:hypothetical protein